MLKYSGIILNKMIKYDFGVNLKYAAPSSADKYIRSKMCKKDSNLSITAVFSGYLIELKLLIYG